MKINKLLLAGTLLTTIGTPIALLATAGALTSNRDDVASDKHPRVQVGVAPVPAKRIRRWDEFNDRISAVESVEIRSRVSGYVMRMAFKEGDEVRQGDPLFTIDQRPYRVALNSAMDRLQRARAMALLAEDRAQRARKLLPSNAVSYDEFQARQASYAQSESDVRDAQAAVDVAKLNLGFTKVLAPMDGHVGRSMLAVGDLAVADQLVLTMVSRDPV